MNDEQKCSVCGRTDVEIIGEVMDMYEYDVLNKEVWWALCEKCWDKFVHHWVY